MVKKVAIQRMGQTMKEGTLVKWLKHDGDIVKAGEPLYEMEYDKASTEILAPIDGILKTIEEEGGTFPVGTVVGKVYGEGETIEEQPRKAASAPVKMQPAEAAVTSSVTGSPKSGYKASASIKRLARQRGIDLLQVIPADGVRITEEDLDCFAAGNQQTGGEAQEEKKVNASALAKKMAKKYGIDLGQITASSASGRISSADVEAFVHADKNPEMAEMTEKTAVVGEAAEGRRVPMSGIRKAIAKNMKESYFQLPVVTYSTDVDMARFLKMRKDLNCEYEAQGIKISINDLLIKAVSKALEKCPNINVSLENEETILYKTDINIGMAVAIENGLLVPVIKNADKKTPGQIACDTKRLAEKARTGKLDGEEMSGGSFTISNLGSKGIDMFTPIINPPESAILGVGKTIDKAVVKDGEIVIRPMMVLSLTADHRVIDGAPAADFLQELKKIIEAPVSMFI